MFPTLWLNAVDIEYFQQYYQAIPWHRKGLILCPIFHLHGRDTIRILSYQGIIYNYGC